MSRTTSVYIPSPDISFTSFEEFIAGLRIHDAYQTPEFIDTNQVPAPGRTKPIRISLDFGRRTHAVNPTDWDSIVVTPVVLNSPPVNVFNGPGCRGLPPVNLKFSTPPYSEEYSATVDDVPPDSPCPGGPLDISDIAEFGIPAFLTIRQRRRLVSHCSPLRICM